MDEMDAKIVKAAEAWRATRQEGFTLQSQALIAAIDAKRAAQSPPPRGERIERSGKDRRIDTNERLELGLGIGPGARNRTMERTYDIGWERTGKDRRAQPQSGEESK